MMKIKKQLMKEYSDYYLSSNVIIKQNRKVPRLNEQILTYNILVKMHNFLHKQKEVGVLPG